MSLYLLFQTFQQNGLSPGHFDVKMDEKRAKKSAKSKLPQTKFRRNALKYERATMKGACEASEGSTYQSGTLDEYCFSSENMFGSYGQ